VLAVPSMSALCLNPLPSSRILRRSQLSHKFQTIQQMMRILKLPPQTQPQ
jgi:hypothetical protein